MSIKSVLKSLADKFNDLMTPVGIDHQSMLNLDPPAKPAAASKDSGPETTKTQAPKPETPGA